MSEENIKIEVIERTNDYMARISDNHGCWGCGKSLNEAVGSLIRYHSERFGIDITYDITKSIY